MKRTIKSVALGVAIGAMLAAIPATGAEVKYPNRPIRFVVGFLPGGPSDTIARVVSGKLAEAFGVAVIVDNRAGAGGNVSATSLRMRRRTAIRCSSAPVRRS